MDSLLLTVSEVAKVLKCNVGYVHKLRKAGLISFMKLGTYKVRMVELERFLEFAEGKDLTDVQDIKLLQAAPKDTCTSLSAK